MLLCKFCYYYYNVESECVYLLILEWDVYVLKYYCLLPQEQFSYSVVWLGNYTGRNNTIGEQFPQE